MTDKYFQKFGESPKDAGTRKLAARLALRGKAISRTHVVDNDDPFCDAPVQITRFIRAGGFDTSLEVNMKRPCRKCAKCLQFRQLRWSQRIQYELHKAPRSWWITLTFSPHHLAGIMAEAAQSQRGTRERRIDDAAYKHVQRYFKRLRKATKASFRYIAVFELGEEHGRAHYHLLIHEISKPITKSAIDQQWRSIVHARLVAMDRKGLPAYISKYATKSLSVAVRASTYYGKEKPPTPTKKKR